CGSMGRTGDFDHHFHPLDDRLRSRWISVAMARRQFIPLPPVSLVQVGACYFVQDGHHRISVARALGESAIDAEVIVWDVSGPLLWEPQPVLRPVLQAA
ncbi:MAG TPA: transcriptional regulator, partial [Anaerolineae bacterium]|nr:transcriptional regulator [Anaerolineae bacterium]